MLMNNLDPDVAEWPEELIVYGGGGKAAGDWESYHKITQTLKRLENDETLLIQSGKPVGVFRTHEEAPIVIGRDHPDTGSVASPNRETESMKDGSDAIADWPLLNAMLNTASGASWVCLHHGGEVGIRYSIHAGTVCVAD